jgi:hypothetical protein
VDPVELLIRLALAPIRVAQFVLGWRHDARRRDALLRLEVAAANQRLAGTVDGGRDVEAAPTDRRGP